ncbi:hypothetical protein O3G_MSEX009101 [Manduca sexta]|uniref:Uncharacterized protein n=1 Tax=Manduca sexta TaxID=7130 RepID=A0A921ZE93_MANSE|nr:hypothetical protein O3G_MSEX009101 [Manduca sexta]
MFSNWKIVRATFTPLYKQGIVMTRRAKTIASSGSDDGKKGDELGIICPCCACPSDYNPSTPTIYNSRKYGHSLPSNDVMPPFDPIPNVPTGIFRCTAGEAADPAFNTGRNLRTVYWFLPA